MLAVLNQRGYIYMILVGYRDMPMWLCHIGHCRLVWIIIWRKQKLKNLQLQQASVLYSNSILD